MTALLRKDLYVVGNQIWILFIMALVFSVIPQFNTAGTCYLLVLSMSLSQSSIGYDERSRWDQFAAMLPVPPWKIVLSKYLVMLFSTFGAGSTAAVINYVQYKFLGGHISVPFTLALLCAVSLLNALFMPVIYRLGWANSRLVLGTVCFGAAVLLIGGLLIRSRAVIRLMEALVRLQSAPQLLPGSAALAAIGNAISFRLSVQFYANRRYGVYES